MTTATLPTTPAAALRLGLTRYYTGRPCKYGHVSERFSNNGKCVECQKTERRKETADARVPIEEVELPDRIAAARWLHRQCLTIAGRIPTPYDTNLLFDDYPRSGWTLRLIKRLRAETKRPRRKGGWERTNG